MKKYITITITLFVTLSATLSLLFFNSNYWSGQKNKRIMIEYIKENYGDDFKIISKSLGKSGWSSGRQYDILTIAQNGITYRIEYYEGKIISDTYGSEMAGKILGDYLLSIVSEPDFKFGLECTVSACDGVTDIDVILTRSATIYLSLYDVPIQNFREIVWLYEFYQTMLSYDFEKLRLYLTVWDRENNLSLDTPHLSFKPRKYDDFTKEEFFDQFVFGGAHRIW